MKRPILPTTVEPKITLMVKAGASRLRRMSLIKRCTMRIVMSILRRIPRLLLDRFFFWILTTLMISDDGMWKGEGE